jgi:Domain of unknown function (DUF222)
MNNSGPSYAGPLPNATQDPDSEWAEYLAWLDRETAAGRDAGPPVWESDLPGSADFPVWESDVPEGTGPEGTGPEGTGPEGPESARPLFGRDGEADVLPPGPLLAGLTEQAVADLGRLSDSELIGVLQATRRQIAGEQYKQVLVTAEFGRRRQASFADAARRGVPVGCRPGGFPGEELASELVTTRAEAGHRIDDALDLTSRLPLTLAGMAAGQIDEARAGWIAMYTRSLAPPDAARADEVLAEAAPDLRVDQVARKAASLEMKLNPEAVRARKEHAKRNEQRVEARRELSGNASLSGRELGTADVLAAKAHIDAIAARLRDSGLLDSTLDRLRALAFADLTQGRNPLDRLNTAGTAGTEGTEGTAGTAALPPADPGTPGGPSASAADPSGAPAGPSGPLPAPNPSGVPNPSDAPDPSGVPNSSGVPGGPLPALGRRSPLPALGRLSPLPAEINLIVPVGSLLGWSTAPAQAGAWGLLDRDETRAVVDAAAQHPRTRWCVTLTAPDGTALAHGCAHGRHSRLLSDLAPQPPPEQLAEILRRLNLVFTPIARGSCDHPQAEEHYVPSRKLKHLVRARTATCDAPGCEAQAVSADLDHTVPWPDGPTDQCNLAPRCRTHHRAKQAPDWKVEQTEPGVTHWTLPSGRTHVTTPTKYDA